jgi:hypothetical protein
MSGIRTSVIILKAGIGWAFIVSIGDSIVVVVFGTAVIIVNVVAVLSNGWAFVNEVDDSVSVAIDTCTVIDARAVVDNYNVGVTPRRHACHRNQRHHEQRGTFDGTHKASCLEAHGFVA